jgi:hypothetical protein
MRSKKFKEDVPPNSPILQIFADHVAGEIAAQQARGGGQLPEAGQPAGSPDMAGEIPPEFQQPLENGQNAEMAATMPGMAQGGGEMPTGMRGAEAGIGTGNKI